MARYRKCHCRCRKCEARRVLRRHPEQYIRVPACRSCGGELRPDRWMNQRWRLAQTCDCQGYWFPHRRGSKHCWYRADGSDKPESEFEERTWQA